MMVMWTRAFLSSMARQRLIRGIIRWLLLIAVVVYLVTGYGITEYRIVESLTFGLLTKVAAFKIHANLWLPFLILLILHIYLSLAVRLKSKKGLAQSID